MEDLELRPEVKAFAQLMERTLRENNWKGGWKKVDEEGNQYGMHLHECQIRLHQELQELDEELFRKARDTPLVIKEAVDVANFAMMLVDLLDGLKAGQPVEKSDHPQDCDCPVCD